VPGEGYLSVDWDSFNEVEANTQNEAGQSSKLMSYRQHKGFLKGNNQEKMDQPRRNQMVYGKGELLFL
jgi:hypothetical protein